MVIYLLQWFVYKTKLQNLCCKMLNIFLFQINSDNLEEIKATFRHLCILSLFEKTNYISTKSVTFLKSIAYQDGKAKKIVENKTDVLDEESIVSSGQNDETFKRSVYGRIFIGKLFYNLFK